MNYFICTSHQVISSCAGSSVWFNKGCLTNKFCAIVGIRDFRLLGLGTLGCCLPCTCKIYMYLPQPGVCALYSIALCLEFNLPLASSLTFQYTICNISNTKGRVWPHFQTPRRELKIRHTAEYFWQASRCLEMWSNMAFSVWYIFSIKTKALVRENGEIIKIYAN